MVDKSGLQLIGWIFGGATAAVMLIAAVLVSDAVASNRPAVEAQAQAMTEQAR